jgi:iron complex transport system substrate-binding protein
MNLYLRTTKPWRALALLLIAGMLIAGCALPVAPAATTSETTTTVTEATAEGDVAEVAPVSTVTTIEAQPDGSLVLQHPYGETVVPAIATRIVPLEWTYVEILMALGVTPVGMADIEGYNAWVNVPLPDDGANLPDVGDRNDANLEAIAALNPDLILGTNYGVQNNYALLSEIAPTVSFDHYPTDPAITHYDEMLHTVRLLGTLTGTSEKAEEVIAHMEQNFADNAAKIAAAGRTGEEFVLSQAYSWEGVQEARLFTPNALASKVVEKLGLTPGWEDGFQLYGFSTVSPERLPELGDVNFFYVVQNDDNIFATEALQPLWESLPLVQAGHAYPLGGDTWLFGGPLSMELLADTVTAALLGENK